MARDTLPSPIETALSKAPSFGLPESFQKSTEGRQQASFDPGNVPYQADFNAASKKYGVPVNVLMALAQQESSFNPVALGQPTKWGRAKGLMQYIDSTAAGMGINPYDPQQSIDAAAKQLKQRLSNGYSIEEAVSAHFGGDDRKQWGPKTRQYGVDVLNKAQKFFDGTQGQIKAPAQQTQERDFAAEYPAAQSAMENMEQNGLRSRAIEIQSALDKLNAEEPGRYRALTPSEVAQMQQQQDQGLLDKANQLNADVKAITQPEQVSIPEHMAQEEQAKAQRDAKTQSITDKAAQMGSDVMALLGSGVNIAAQDLRELVSKVPMVGKPIVDAADRFDRWANGKGSEELFKEWDQKAEKTFTPELAAARKKSWVVEPGDDLGGGKKATSYSFGPAWSDPRAYMSGILESLPEMALTMGGSGRLASMAYKRAIASGASREVAAKAAARTATVAGGLLEGGLGGAQASRETREQINKMTPDQLKDSEALKALMDGGKTFEQARAEIADNASSKAFLLAGIGTGIFGGMGDRAIAKIITGNAGGRLKSALTGAIGEGLFEEAPQSALQQMGQNYAMQEADPNTPLMRGVANQVAGGAAVGGLMGAGMGAAAPRVGETTSQPAEVPPQADAAPVDAQPVQQAAAEPVTPTAARDDSGLSSDAGPLERAVRGTADQPNAANGNLWAGEPGNAINIQAKGDPSTAMDVTIDRYENDGSVTVRDGTGTPYTVTPDDIDINLPQEEQAAAPVQEEQPAAQPEIQQQAEQVQQATDDGMTVDPATGEIIEGKPAVREIDAPQERPLTDQSEDELRARMRYIAQQAKQNGGMDKRLMDARRQVEKALNAKIQQRKADEQPASVEAPAQAEPDIATAVQPDESRIVGSSEGNDAGIADQSAAGGRTAISGNTATADASPALIGGDGKPKWFSTQDKAKAFIDRRKLDGYDAVQVKPNRFEIHKIQEAVNSADERLAMQDENLNGQAEREVNQSNVTLTNEGNKTEAPKLPKGKKESPRVNRARKVVGAEGNIVSPSGDVGYASAGAKYKINGIDKNGTIHLTNQETGSSTTLSVAEMESGRSRNVVWNKQETAAKQPAAESVAEPAPAQQNEQQNIPENIPETNAAPQETAEFRENENSSTENVRENADSSTKPAEYGANNKLVSQDRAAELRQRLKAKFSQLNSGIDPEILAIGTELAVFHIEAGVRKFADFAKAMANDLDLPLNRVRPYLRSWYNGARDMMEDSGVSIEGMDTAETVRSELAKLNEQPAASNDQPTAPAPQQAEAPKSSTRQPSRATGAMDDMVSQFDNEVPNVSTPRTGLEPDSAAAGNAKSVNESANVDESGANGQRPAAASRRADAERGDGQRDQRVSDDGAATGREPGDQLVHREDGQFRPSEGVSGSDLRTRSAGRSEAGLQTERTRATAVAANAHAAGADDFTQRLKAQKAAPKDTKWADEASVRASLPMLLPAQQGDVVKVEQRHLKDNGIVITNGTGTGKTMSGLGVAKRFHNAGKTNILVLVPSDKIASDWVKSAAWLDMPLKQLSGITDNGGSGPVITTYANLGQNNALAQREWDLVIPDESHRLMQNESGDVTEQLRMFRALTGHPDGFSSWMQAKYADQYAKLSEANMATVKDRTENNTTAAAQKREQDYQKQLAAWNALYNTERAKWNEKWEKQQDMTKVVFLSATPFAYVMNTDYAEGFLFHHVPPTDRFKDRSQGGYNSGNPRDSFYIQHFGYRMRYNKLTRPDAEVNTELMEQSFNQWLKDQGALIGRSLDVPYDYDRKFVLIDDAAGKKLDQALEFLQSGDNGQWRNIYTAVMDTFDHQRKMFLLESMKARAAVPIIKQHLALGRKVLVVHDYNMGGGFNPFSEALKDMDPALRPAARELFQRPLFRINFSGLDSALNTLLEAFPNALTFNGTVPKAKRRANADKFNDDLTGPNLLIAQSDAMREGVSVHDTSGKHQRIELNLGLPTQPTKAIQLEGRIYRTGQASDAIFRYMTTGTAWEASAFASKLAERASTAENLAMGPDSRALKQSFITAYQEAAPITASKNDGKGGKDADQRGSNTISEFDKAKSYYYAQQKNTKSRDQREGVDYFATPEPVGLKMVEWAGIKPGDKVLEPSAGHGAIARFFPERTEVTMVEPSLNLSQRAALANGGARIVNQRFEDFNRTNKYDAIVMNPPYGMGGKTAYEHLEKATQHLREGGRIVALLPRGGLADRRLVDFMPLAEENGIHVVADISMPSSTFERAGTKVNTRVLVLEKNTSEDYQAPETQRTDLSSAESVNELFDRIEDLDVPERQALNQAENLQSLRFGEPQTETPAFQSWFDGSKVVDGNGSPLVVYHGTSGDFSAFDPGMRGSNTRDVDSEKGYFFSSSQDIANEYAAESGTTGNNVMPVYLSLKNPLTVDHKGKGYSPEMFDRYIQQAKEEGRDGVIIRNSRDDFRNQLDGDTYIAFEPTQIKSAIGNGGGFNPANPDVLMSVRSAGLSSREMADKLKAEYPGLKISLTGTGDVVTLQRIELPAESRNLGTGTAIMQQITSWADANGKTVALSPSSDFGGSKARLNEFYKRFGFVDNKGRNKDYAISETMYREPKQQELQSFTNNERPASVEDLAALNRMRGEQGQAIPADKFGELLRRIEFQNRTATTNQEKVLATLRAAEISGVYSKEGAQLATWLIRQYPHLASELNIQLSRGSDETPAGNYNVPDRLITLFSDFARDGRVVTNSDLSTATHEIMHHMERMMPRNVQEAIANEWTQALEARMQEYAEAGDSRREHLLADLVAGMYGDKEGRQRAYQAFATGELPRSDYQYASPSEYWAENGARIIAERKARGDAPKTWVDRAIEVMKQIIAKIRSILGAKGDDPSAVMEALDSVLAGDGKFVNNQIINRTGDDMYGLVNQFGDYQAPDLQSLRSGMEPDPNIPTEAQDNAKVRNWWDRLKNLPADTMTDSMKHGLGLLPLRPLATELGKNIPSLMKYMSLKQSMDAMRNKWHAKTDGTAQKWLKYRVTHPVENVKMMDLMHDATIAQVDPSEAFEPMMTDRDRDALRTVAAGSEQEMELVAKAALDDRRFAAWGELSATYKELSPQGKEIFKEVRDAYTEITNEYEKTLLGNMEKAINVRIKRAEREHRADLQRIVDEGLTGKEKEEAQAEADKKLKIAKTKTAWNRKARVTQLRVQFEMNRLQGPYFPLARFGNLFVTVRDKESGRVESFSRFESAREQREFAQLMRENPKYTVQVGALDDSMTTRKAVDANFVADVEDILADLPNAESVKDEVWQRYLESLPDFSIRKNRIHRTGRKGYNADALRAFGNQMFHSSHQLARLKHTFDMEEALDAAREEAGKTKDPVRDGLVVNEMEKRHQYIMNPTGGSLATKLTSAAFLWFLAASPTTAIRNLAQTPMIGIPVMAAFDGGKNGVGRAINQFTRASADILRGKGSIANSKALTADEKKAIQEAYDIGIIDRTQAHDLASIGETGIDYSPLKTRLMAAASWAFHHTERINREVTVLMAYRMARAKGLSHKEAIQAANDLTWKTHFDYQNNSRPRVMHNDMMKVALVFRNYSINMLYRLFRDIHQSVKGDSPAAKREARIQLAGITGMMMLGAGLTGTWGAGIVFALASAFMDDDKDPEQELKKSMVEALGPMMAGIVLDGVPGYVTGTSQSESLGMRDLWFRSPNSELEGKNEFEYWQSQLLGATPSIASNILRGYGLIKQGETYRGIETMMPKAIKDPMKAYRYATDGATNTKGDTIVEDVGYGDVIRQALGSTPAKLAEQYDINNAGYNLQQGILRKRQNLLNSYAKASDKGDTQKQQEITDQIVEFNEKYPEQAITGKTITRSMKTRAQNAELATGGMRYNRKLRDRILEEQAPRIYE